MTIDLKAKEQQINSLKAQLNGKDDEVRLKFNIKDDKIEKLEEEVKQLKESNEGLSAQINEDGKKRLAINVQKDCTILELRNEIDHLKRNNEQFKEIENIEFDFELPFNDPPERDSTHDSLSDDTVHFNAWLLTERVRGHIKKGEKEMKDGSEYVGELDWYGAACGEGELTRKDGAVVKGTWLNDQQHGFCIEEYKNGQRMEEEFKYGMRHGKSTWYWTNQNIDNRTYNEDQRVTMVKVNKPKDAFFGDGKPVKPKPLN